MEPLDKCVWTEDDFERMGWHDASVHAIAVDWDRAAVGPGAWRGADVLLDIDYIVSWLRPRAEGRSFEFTVAPATLVFEDAWDIEGTLTREDTIAPAAILDLHRHAPEPQAADRSWRWHLEGDRFELRLRSAALRQHFRRQPISTGSAQRLTVEQRGGFSFARPLSFSEGP